MITCYPIQLSVPFRPKCTGYILPFFDKKVNELRAKIGAFTAEKLRKNPYMDKDIAT